jgi:hypothetical protein
MANKKVHGVCRLCRKRRVLCKSHYLGRAVERLCREKNEPAVLMTPKLILGTSRQLWAHLLCLECEGRLNKLGETPTLKWLDNGSGFPLLERMRLAIEIKVETKAITFSGSAMGIDTEALAHFALGILWKGAVHKWTTVAGQTTSVNLAGYKESIRKYLLGKDTLPSEIFVMIAACEDKGSRGMVFAPSKVRGSRHRMYSLLVRGLWFHVIADRQAPASLKNLCCLQSERKVLHLEDCTERFLHAGRHIHKTARIARNMSRR